MSVSLPAGADPAAVFLSLSGSGGFKHNARLGGDRTILFEGLQPGTYYLKPLLREHSFEPPVANLQLEDGQQLELDLTAVRTAWGISGLVTSGAQQGLEVGSLRDQVLGFDCVFLRCVWADLAIAVAQWHRVSSPTLPVACVCSCHCHDCWCTCRGVGFIAGGRQPSTLVQLSHSHDPLLPLPPSSLPAVHTSCRRLASPAQQPQSEARLCLALWWRPAEVTLVLCWTAPLRTTVGRTGWAT